LDSEVKTIFERTHRRVQTLTEVVQHNKSENNDNIESLRNDMTAIQTRIERQSADVCEGVSTCETRVTDLKDRTEQKHNKVS
jgi:hypothetical protein